MENRTDHDVVVVGQIGRDLVLRVDRLPDGGSSTDVLQRIEVLGGKGANQAVAFAQLGVSPALIGVVGNDDAGKRVLEQARQDGIDVSAVVRRRDCPTALLVDVVEDDGTRRLLEDVADGVLLRPEDVAAASGALRTARAVVLQLQQPPDTVRAVLASTLDDALVVADGAPGDEPLREELLRRAAVLRADAGEAETLVGRPLDGLDDVVAAARELVAAGPRVVALSAGSDGDVVAWDGGCLRTPLLDLPANLRPEGTHRTGDSSTADPTGAGDSYVVGMTTALLDGASPAAAARLAAAAAALTAARVGGRPALTRGLLAAAVAEVVDSLC